MKQLKLPTLSGSRISVWFCPDWEEYQVKVQGKPKATYHTTDRNDAIQTAQQLRNNTATNNTQ